MTPRAHSSFCMRSWSRGESDAPGVDAAEALHPEQHSRLPARTGESAVTLSPLYEAKIRMVRVDFGFSSFVCDPDEITTALGIVPDQIRRKGEIRELRGGQRMTVPVSTWCISSRVESKDVNEHCRELLRRLEGCATRLDPRWGVPGFHVLWKATHFFGGNGPFFLADVVSGIAALGAELWQDLYAVEDGEPGGGAPAT